MLLGPTGGGGPRGKDCVEKDRGLKWWGGKPESSEKTNEGERGEYPRGGTAGPEGGGERRKKKTRNDPRGTSPRN